MQALRDQRAAVEAGNPILGYARPGWMIPAETISVLRLREFVEKLSGSPDLGTSVALERQRGQRDEIVGMA